MYYTRGQKLVRFLCSRGRRERWRARFAEGMSREDQLISFNSVLLLRTYKINDNYYHAWYEWDGDGWLCKVGAWKGGEGGVNEMGWSHKMMEDKYMLLRVMSDEVF